MPRSVREIFHEAAAVPRQPLDLDRLRTRSRRRRVRVAGTGMATLLVVGLVAALAVTRPGPNRPGPDPTGMTGTSPLADLPAGWTELPRPPQVRHHGATQWTGETLL